MAGTPSRSARRGLCPTSSPQLDHALLLPDRGEHALQEINDPLGSGPYYVASRVPNRQVVLERNRFYRGPRPRNVDRAVWTFHGREACRVAVERNELDYCAGLGVPSSAYTELAAEHGINKKDTRFFFTPELTMWYFAFNHDRRAFKGAGQIPLKQAINWAIDRPDLVGAAGYDAGKRTDQLLPASLGRDESIYPLGAVTPEAGQGSGAARQGEVPAEASHSLRRI